MKKDWNITVTINHPPSKEALEEFAKILSRLYNEYILPLEKQEN